MDMEAKFLGVVLFDRFLLLGGHLPFHKLLLVPYDILRRRWLLLTAKDAGGGFSVIFILSISLDSFMVFLSRLVSSSIVSTRLASFNGVTSILTF